MESVPRWNEYSLSAGTSGPNAAFARGRSTTNFATPNFDDATAVDGAVAAGDLSAGAVFWNSTDPSKTASTVGWVGSPAFIATFTLGSARTERSASRTTS